MGRCLGLTLTIFTALLSSRAFGHAGYLFLYLSVVAKMPTYLRGPDDSEYLKSFQGDSHTQCTERHRVILFQDSQYNE